MRKQRPAPGTPAASGALPHARPWRGALAAALTLLGGASMAAAQPFGFAPGMAGGRFPCPAQSVPGPHPTWALVRPDGGSNALEARTLVRDSLIAALGATGIAPEGFPRPCAIVREPDPERPPGWFTVSCADPAAGVEGDGILLGPDNQYMALEVVDFPHARAFLLEVFLVPRLPHPPLDSDRRFDLPRVVVFHPLVSAEWHPAIWRAIEEGVASTGARRLPLQ